MELNSNTVFGWHWSRVMHEMKGYLDATVDTGSTKLDVVVTHLYEGDLAVRISEAGELADHLGRKQNPYILLGDLNSLPARQDIDNGKVIERLSGVARPVETHILTYSSEDPKEKLDYILTSKYVPSHESRAIGSDASDHLALCCGIELGGIEV